MRARYRLAASAVRSPKPGKYPDGGGLWLVVSDSGSAKWVLRVTLGGRRREMGLGSTRDVPLRLARDLAEKWRMVVAAGQDPFEQREAEERRARKADTSLTKITDECFEARKQQLRADGAAGAVRRSIVTSRPGVCRCRCGSAGGSTSIRRRWKTGCASCRRTHRT